MPETGSAKRDTVVDLYDRDATAALINGLAAKAESNQRFPELVDRDGRKRILARLGVDAKATDDYRMMLYRDSIQEVILLGNRQPNGTVEFTRSIVVPLSKKSDDHPRVHALVSGTVKQLPEPIRLPVVTGSVERRPGTGGEPSEVIRLTADQARELETRVTLLAMADAAVNIPLDADELEPRVPATPRLPGATRTV
jgi:hypothetical protein